MRRSAGGPVPHAGLGGTHELTHTEDAADRATDDEDETTDDEAQPSAALADGAGGRLGGGRPDSLDDAAGIGIRPGAGRWIGRIPADQARLRPTRGRRPAGSRP